MLEICGQKYSSSWSCFGQETVQQWVLFLPCTQHYCRQFVGRMIAFCMQWLKLTVSHCHFKSCFLCCDSFYLLHDFWFICYICLQVRVARAARKFFGVWKGSECFGGARNQWIGWYWILSTSTSMIPDSWFHVFQKSLFSNT
jgi:hypothetical protein